MGSAWLNRAIGKLRLEAFDEAASDVDRALADQRLSKSDRAIAYLQRGSARLRLGAPGAALEDFDKVIEVAPEHAEIHVHRGDALYGLGDYEEAVAAYSVAIRDTVSAAALVGRGRAFIELGKLDAASNDLDRATKIDIRSFEASFVYAEVLFRRRDFSAAYREYERAYNLATNEDLASKAAARQGQGFAAYNANMTLDSAMGFHFGFGLARDPLRGAIWAYLAGLLDRSIPFAEYLLEDGLKTADKELAADQWPAAMVRLIKRKGSVSDVLEAAETGDAKLLHRQRCEAYLFLGEYARGIGSERARSLLSRAVELCEGLLYEHLTATLSLRLVDE